MGRAALQALLVPGRVRGPAGAQGPRQLWILTNRERGKGYPQSRGSAWSYSRGLGQGLGHSGGFRDYQFPSAAGPTRACPPCTSTDDSPRRKTGATVTSGSLWKMLGLAWCWKWRKFHQWAEKPCRGGGSQEWGQATPPSPWQRHTCADPVRPPHQAPGCPPPAPSLTFSCPITNCWATWFHRDFLDRKSVV